LHFEGWEVRPIAIDQVGWDSERNIFVDLENNPIRYWFKLYPWENLATEDFGPHLKTKLAPTVFEPPWKMILSNKASLPLLWQLNPGHKNLLPSYFSESDARQHIAGSIVSKPIFGREGANIAILNGETVLESSAGVYGNDPIVWQECVLPPKFGEFHAVVGSWVIGDSPAGICVREDSSPITKNVSRFVSHVFG
jgi:glutathionylspermidine synthase